MLVIASVLLIGFIGVVTAMVHSVSNGNSPFTMPGLSALALPAWVDVVDSHATCKAQACDGTGAVVHWDPIVAPAELGTLVGHFKEHGWSDTACMTATRCMANEDLRITMMPWSDTDLSTTAALRSAIRDRGLIEEDFVYVRVFRCGVNESC